MNVSFRYFVDPDTGERYHVRLTPRELAGARGVSQFVNSVVFETEAGEWIGVVPVFSPYRLDTTAERDLKVMLERAKQRAL